MECPDIPSNEKHRLETLRSLNVLDTPSEERYDRVTRLARRMFDVPIALVSLIDADRQWFKSCQGLDASETPRDISFCGHAILGNKTFFIQDASKDTRFSDNPLVTGPPDIRFYAGQPLRAPNGDMMGTLCIIDSLPKNLKNEDFAALEDLAIMVEQEFAALQLATMDELSDLSNRRGFIKLAEQCLSLCQRKEIVTTLAYFDLNNFKHINDTHGHDEGDRAIQMFSNQMKESFRSADILARIGGDEFVVLLTNADQPLATSIVKRFSSDLIALSAKLGLDYTIQFSCGLVQYDQETHKDIDGLITSADGEMYKVKRA